MRLCIFLSLITVALNAFNSLALAHQSYQVLAVHSYSEEYPWTKSQHRGFVDKLIEKSSIPIIVSTEYLDTKRRAYSPKYAKQFGRFIQEKYRGYTPNIIYVTDDNGYRFARDHLQKLYPDTPIIFSGINNYGIIDELKSLPLRGVFEKKDITKNLDIIINLDEKDTEILILSDSANSQAALKSKSRRHLANHPDINVKFIVHNNIENLIKDLRNHDQKYFFINSIGRIRSETGFLVSPDIIVSEIAESGDFTIITLEDSYFYDGVLGGYVTSGRLQGEEAARMALALQKGTKIEQIKNIIDSPNTYIFDQTLLQKLKISLPVAVSELAEFHKIPPGFYVRNRGLILTTLILMSIVLIILVGLIVYSRIKKKEEEARREEKRTSQIERYQKAMITWSEVNHKNSVEAFRRAVEISSNTLDVKRVGIWLFDEAKTNLDCHTMYINGEGFSGNSSLSRANFPCYFSAIETGLRLVIDDARNDLVSIELTDSYLLENDIYSVLNVPISYDGNIIGVLSHEHTGDERKWTVNEQEFPSILAGDISLSLEISKRKEIEKNLEHQAYHDSLTGLPNRALVLDRIEHEMKHASRGKSNLAVLFLDLDNFKQINDSFGHSAGDTVLISISERLKHALREIDTIARLGGDEFIILLSDFRNVEDINDIVFKLFNAIKQPISIDNNEIFVTVSIGISVFPNDGANAEILLRNADAAMYRAKEKGLNAFEFYTEDMTERAFEKVLMISNLNRALEQKEFEVFYQPQYDSLKKQLVGLEALIRWHHPDIGFLLPATFLLTAEESGLIVMLDRWVMQKSLQQMKTWQEQGIEIGRLSLNLTMQQIDQPDFVEYLKKLLKDTGCPGESITFEITEGQLMKNPERTIEILNQLSQLGIKISVDDFGTGYSSLAYLKKLPVDTIKIDREFIRDIPTDEDDASIIKAMIALAKSMRIDILAEGVETSEQLKFLTAEGCHLIQGNYLSQPLKASDIAGNICYPLKEETRVKRRKVAYIR